MGKYSICTSNASKAGLFSSVIFADFIQSAKIAGSSHDMLYYDCCLWLFTLIYANRIILLPWHYDIFDIIVPKGIS